MLILECSQGCYGRTDGSVTISLRNFVGEGIIKGSHEPVNRKFIDTLPYHSKCSVLIYDDLNPITPGAFTGSGTFEFQIRKLPHEKFNIFIYK